MSEYLADNLGRIADLLASESLVDADEEAAITCALAVLEPLMS